MASIIGLGNSQVSTNGMLGSLAFQGDGNLISTKNIDIKTETSYHSLGMGKNSLQNFSTNGNPQLFWNIPSAIKGNNDSSYSQFPGTIIQDSKDYGIRILNNYTPQIIGGKTPTISPIFLIYVVGGLSGSSIIYINDSNLLNYDYDNTTIFQIPTSDIGGTLPLQFTLDPSKFPKYYISSQIAIGKNALKNNTVGNNIAIGAETLFSATTGTQNVAIGWKSLYSTTTGGNNIAIGPRSLQSNITGSTNIAMGVGALDALTSGSANIGLGQQALAYTATSNNSVVIGAFAGIYKISSSNDVAIGVRALSGNNLVNAGSQKLSFSIQNGGSGYTDGTYNITLVSSNFFSGNKNENIYTVNVSVTVTGGVVQSVTQSGLFSGQKIPQVGDLLYPVASSTTLNPGKGLVLQVTAIPSFGGNNTTVGSFGLNSIQSGSNNVTLGYNSGAGVTSGSNNVFLGYSAGSTLTTESNNVIIGGNTGSGLVGLSSNISISDGAGNERIRVDIAGNVGVGTTNPSQSLHVSGNLRVTGAIYDSDNNVGLANSVLSSTGSGIRWIAPPSGGLTAGSANQVIYKNNLNDATGSNNLIFDGGNLLIGTATSTGTISQRLQVSGGAHISGNVGIGTTVAPARLTVLGNTANVLIGNVYTNANGITLNGSTASTDYNLLSTSTNNLVVNRPSGRTIIFAQADTTHATFDTSNNFIMSSGNIALGNFTPSYNVDGGAATLNRAIRFGGIILGTAGNSYGAVGYNAKPSGLNAWTYDVTDTSSWIQFLSGGHVFYRAVSGTAGVSITPLETARFDSSGNFGLGVSSPLFKMDVSGDVRLRSTSRMRFGGTSTSSNYSIQYNSTANSLDFVVG